ncbi:MAG TPA: hypothetical protein VFL14_11410 [Xanthomonadales bacterium]|nr:hypothetical protein [Xanthomonadales bacterium]
MDATVARETFYAAQARHRRAARRWLLLIGGIVLALVSVVGILLAPPIYALIGLLLDVVDRIAWAPDLLGWVAATIDALANGAVPPALRVVGVLALAALPGFLLLMLGWWRLGRLEQAHEAALARALGLREPRTTDVEERQFANVVAEMAIAAGCPLPGVRILDVDAVNLGVFGDGAEAVLFATRGALAHLSRDHTQALAGQLVASLVDGDGRLAERIVRLTELLGLVVLVAQAPLSSIVRRTLRPLLGWRAPGEETAATIRRALADPLDFFARHETAEDRAQDSKPGWREWLLMPLMGSALVGAVIVPIATTFLLGPLLGLLWRRRRLLADATAVRLTRNPQALAEAYLACMGQRTTLGDKAPWLVHLFALDVAPAPLLKLVSPYPPWRKRIARLVAQGAIVELPAAPPFSWMPIVVGVPLFALVGTLMAIAVVLSIWLTVALNMLFLALPAALLHAVLRA